jgi:CRISPR-associated protein Cmr3
LEVAADAQCGWPAGVTLQPVGQVDPLPDKPLSGESTPHFWHWQAFEKWLMQPDDGLVTLDELGHGGAIGETRMHVRVDAGTQTAAEGMLFQTGGREFMRIKPPKRQEEGQAEKLKEEQPADDRLPATRRLADAVRLALACASDDKADAQLHAGVGPMGGERRLARWRRVAGELPEWPAGLPEQIVKDGACRLLLLTPACFEAGLLPTWAQGGALPTWLNSAALGLCVSVEAVVLGRYQAVSGWDFEHNQPKAVRKLAPAGAVYFLKLDGTDAARKQFVEDVWMQCVSDDEQSRLDGFGLAALGVWDGELKRMQPMMEVK